jgi:hypothetical protein
VDIVMEISGLKIRVYMKFLKMNGWKKSPPRKK